MCIQSGILKPTWALLEKKIQKHQRKREKKAVVLVFTDGGVFMLVSFPQSPDLRLGKGAKSLLLW
jgi:hypothetical protein